MIALTVKKQGPYRLIDAIPTFCATLPNGYQQYVQSVRGIWIWNKDYPFASPADGFLIVRPLTWFGPGAFFRSAYSDPYWTTRAYKDWCFDVNGDDENDGGSIAAPLRTREEFERRVGRFPTYAIVAS